MLRAIFLISCSLIVVGCAKIQRPDSDLCIFNEPGKKLTCYNLKADYNNDGEIIAGAKPHFKPVNSLDDLNKQVVMDADSFSKLKVYVKLLREEYQRGCSNP